MVTGHFDEIHFGEWIYRRTVISTNGRIGERIYRQNRKTEDLIEFYEIKNFNFILYNSIVKSIIT